MSSLNWQHNEAQLQLLPANRAHIKSILKNPKRAESIFREIDKRQEQTQPSF
jgi:hypothetical protein